MENVTDRTRNPFGMTPDCDRYVPGFGDANADFHVIGDHPGVHGGLVSEIPFTDEAWSNRFFAALAAGGLVDAPDGDHEQSDGGRDQSDWNRDSIRPRGTFLSYLHMCAVDGTPTEASYTDMERFFDAELRAIAAHVLFPVGARATAHVFEQYTARSVDTALDMTSLHATELLGSGWLVMPIKEPAGWDTDDGERLTTALTDLQATDFRRESDLGRFIAGSDPYLVR